MPRRPMPPPRYRRAPNPSHASDSLHVTSSLLRPPTTFQRPADLDLFTVTVGRKPSAASSYLADHNDVVELLKMVGSIQVTADDD